MPPLYDLISADPAWRYRNIKTGGSHTSGAAQKYPTMPLFDIEILPVPEIAAKNSILALWATTPLGRDPYTVMESWGYTYKTELYWHKVGRKGTGYWLRGEVEKLLIGIRGKVPAWRANVSNWLDAPEEVVTILAEGDEPQEAGLTYASVPQGHSRKPAAVRELLELVTPGARRCELFATEEAFGWDCYGLQLGHDFYDPAFWASLGVVRAPVSTHA